MSCNWCTNRSFMVLMSLLKSPIARFLLFREHDSARRRHADMFDADVSANGLTTRLFLPSEKTSRGEPWNTARDGTAKSNAKTRISSVRTYVRRVTAAAIEGRSWRCQGLHNETFLPYGSSHMGRLGRRLPSIASMGFQLVAALPGG